MTRFHPFSTAQKAIWIKTLALSPNRSIVPERDGAEIGDGIGEDTGPGQAMTTRRERPARQDKIYDHRRRACGAALDVDLARGFTIVPERLQAGDVAPDGGKDV